MAQEHPIRVVARRTGLTPHVIRVWEKRYSAVVPGRTSTRRRFYTDEDVERLILLRRATLSGRSIGQVARLSREELVELLKADDSALPLAAPIGLPEGADDPVDGYVSLCLKAIQALNAAELESCLARAAAGLSQPVFLEQFLVRLMTRVGDCWRDGSLRVMHEHLVSSSLRTFLGGLGTGHLPSASAPLLIATTPAGQLHEMGALATAATAASEGWRVLYLGPNLPAEEIAGAARHQEARVVALSIMYPADDSRLDAELVRLRQALPPQVELLAGGRATGGYQHSLQEVRAVIIEDLASFRKHLESLRLRPRR